MRASLRLLAGFCLLPLLAPTAHAQSPCATGTATSDLFANNVRARLYNDGRLFWKGSGNVYNVPATPLERPAAPNAIFSSHLWIGGRVAGEVRMAAGHESGSSELIPGPLDAQGRPPADCTTYDRIARITRADLDALARGTTTDAVRNWPWMWGAPVVDGDGVTGNYNLAGGDRPELLGSETHWWVMNAMGAHDRTGSAPFPLEVQVSAFAVASAEAALDDATLYRYRLVWRGPGTLTDASAGILTDVDLGNASDDLVGADSALAMAYSYNADNVDEGSEGYGTPPPAVGTAFVQAPSIGGGAHSAQWHIKNNDQWGTPAPGPQAFLNRLLGLSSSGAPHPRCGDARDQQYLSCGTTRFTFTGFPETRTGWTMLTPSPLSTPVAASDHRMLISAGPFTLQSNEPRDLVVAVTWARGTDHLNSVAALRAATQRVQDVWRATGFRGLPEYTLTAPQAAPVPVAPADLAAGQPSMLTFVWEPVLTTASYTLEIATADGFLPIVTTKETRVTVTLPDNVAVSGRAFAWRVRASNRVGEGPWSATQRFMLGPATLASRSAGYRDFLTTRNSAGPINPPTYGAIDANGRGFPHPNTTGSVPAAGQQSTNASLWGFHTTDTDGTDGGYDYFVSRTLRDGANAAQLGAHAYEMRFTGTSVGYNAFTDKAVYTVPFELWDVGTRADASDDVRLVPWIEPIAGGQNAGFDIGADHPTSGGTNDPQTDGVFWMRPNDTTPGQAGYLASVARLQANPQGYDGSDVQEVMARTVLVNFNGGTQLTGPFNARLPESGTVFRIETYSPLASPPVPAAPADGAVTTTTPVLYWHEPEGTDQRWVEVARDAAFTDLVVQDTATTAGTYTVRAPIVAGRMYYWRVRVRAYGGFGTTSDWSTVARFTAGVSTAVAANAALPEVLSLGVPAPHPVGASATVRLGVPAAGTLRVRLYDLLGRERAVLFDGTTGAGYATLPLDAALLAPGVYVLRAEHSGKTVTRSVVIAR